MISLSASFLSSRFYHNVFSFVKQALNTANGFSKNVQTAAKAAIVAFKKTVLHSAMGEVSYGVSRENIPWCNILQLR